MPPTSWFETYLRGEPIDLKGRAGLLLDNALVEDRWNISRSFNQPAKSWRNPVAVADKPWEPSGLVRPSVLWDDEVGLFRMWYTIQSNRWFPQGHGASGPTPDDWQSKVIGYAESEDGITWHKPAVRSYIGYPDTNVVFRGAYQTAASLRVSFNRPSTGQPGRFLLSYGDYHPRHGRCLCFAYSDDGVNWRYDPANPVYWPVQDTALVLTHDEANQRWLFYTRPNTYAGVASHWAGLTETKRNLKRRAAVAVGETPYTLGPVRGLRWPDEGEPPDCDLFLVNRVGSHYLAFVSGLFNPPQYNAQIYLASSFDGLNWDRLPDNPPVIPRGSEGQFDYGQAEGITHVVDRADMHYLFYCGSPGAQKTPNNEYAVGLARVRRHRFVSQMAGDEGGYLLTRLVRVTHPHLRVNLTLPTTVGARTDFQAELLAPDSARRRPPRPRLHLRRLRHASHRRPRCPRPLARARRPRPPPEQTRHDPLLPPQRRPLHLPIHPHLTTQPNLPSPQSWAAAAANSSNAPPPTAAHATSTCSRPLPPTSPKSLPSATICGPTPMSRPSTPPLKRTVTSCPLPECNNY